MAGGDRPVSWMKMHAFCTLMVWCILVPCRWHLRIVALKTNFAQPRRSADTSRRIICFCADTTAHCRYPMQEFFWAAHLHLSCCGKQKKKNNWEPRTSICIWREQFRQAQSLSSCNAWLLLLLEVYYSIVVRASIEGIHWFYDSWKGGFILIVRVLTLPLISWHPPCVQTNHWSSEKLLLYCIVLTALIVPLSKTCLYSISASLSPTKQTSCYMCKVVQGLAREVSGDRFCAGNNCGLR